MEKENKDERSDSSSKGKVATEGFMGILFAVIALGIMFWVGVRLMEPYPTYKTPEEAVYEAKMELAKAPADESMSEGMKEAGEVGDEKASKDLAGNKKDPICGMNPYNSPTRLEVLYSDGSRTANVSLACFFQFSDQHAEHGIIPTDIKVVTYDTWQSEKPKLIDAKSAVYLVELEALPQGSMPPGVVAFSSEADAKKFQPDLGGRIVGFEEMEKFVRDFLKEQS